MGNKGLFPGRVSEANQGRGQPRRGYRRPKPTAHSDVCRLRSRRAACFLWYFLSLRKKVLPPSGRQPQRSRRSRRVDPPDGIFYSTVGLHRCLQRLSTRLYPLRVALWNDNTQPAPESARRSPGGIFLRPRALLVTKSVRPFPP